MVERRACWSAELGAEKMHILATTAEESEVSVRGNKLWVLVVDGGLREVSA